MTTRFFNIIIFIIAIMAVSCDNGTVPPAAEGETIYYNGRIYTVNTNQPWADAMYIKDGIIKYVGDEATAREAASEGATLIDLEGSFVMPGIHDVHQHPLEASSSNFHFTIDSTITDAEIYATDALAAVNSTSGTGWVLGWGHQLKTVLAATRNPKEILDDATTSRPLVIMENTSHSVWCNSKALELMGINANTPNPTGGIIMRDSNGEATGILIDNAGNQLLNLALQPSSDREQNDYEGLRDFGLPELAKYGITSICDARTYWKRNHHVVWQRLADESLLTVRVNLGLWAYPTEDDASQIATLKSLYSSSENSLLRINQIKLYSDGVVHNTTAAMHGDYLKDYFHLSTNNGLNYFTEQRTGEYIAALESTGFDFHIHTIGDRGIAESLNAIEQNGTTNGRHRLTHVEIIAPADIPRFAQLNVTADAQVAGDFSQPHKWHGNHQYIGTALSENIIPIKSLAAANARITLSSDWDVSTVNPFVGLQNAVTRAPQELTLEEAIAAYTINAAYVMRQEDKVGSLEANKEADFIILDKNPFDIDVNEINTISVLETYLRGVPVY